MSARFVAAATTSPRMFWLDGGGARPWSGARSILGVLAPDDISLTFDASSREVTRHQGAGHQIVGEDIFEALAGHLSVDEGDSAVSWVGYLGYACRSDLPGRPSGDGLPDAVWMRVRDPLVLRGMSGSPGPADLPASDDAVPTEVYRAGFAAVQEQLRAGNSYEVNLTYREQVDSPLDPVAVYLRLRSLNAAPYSGYLQHHGVHLLSSSPERFATIDRHRMIEAKPIKGTTPRGTTAARDEANRAQLTRDERFRAENLMITDLLRNDLSMVCETGSVEVPSLMGVESYQSVHQLVSTVRGRLRPEISTIAALREIFPAGSMTGAPKRRTMAIIDEVETSPRGVYAGAFGWLSADGRADLSVVIRSLVGTGCPSADPPLWRYAYGTGGGITVHSDVEAEWAETRWKAARLRAALGL